MRRPGSPASRPSGSTPPTSPPTPPRSRRGPTGWKLPDGVDHILFLLALMLAGGTLVRILGIVSGFTLGHSITLALSALHIVRPPASIIEPLIALSIVLVAAEALLG